MFRVLHIGKFYPPDNGGIESVTASLARGAVRAGHFVTVHCFEENAKGYATDGGVQVCRIPQTMKLASQPLSIKYLWRGWKLSLQADLIHVHVPNMLGAMLVIVLPSNAKVVVHWHSDVVGKGLLSRILKPLEKAMLRRADRIICTSQYYADASEIVRPFMAKVTIIPLGVPDKCELNTPKDGRHSKCILPEKIFNHIRNRPLVLSVGRLVPYKGYDNYIDSIKLMTTDAAIVIIGGGPLAKILQMKVEKSNLQDRVLFAGRVEDHTLTNLLSMATVFCMPSNERSEAFGVALLEAMVWGVPIVSYNIPGSGVPWVNLHGVSGVNVPLGDSVELAYELDNLLTDHVRRKNLAIGSRLRYEKFFVEQQAIDLNLDVYSKLLGDK